MKDFLKDLLKDFLKASKPLLILFALIMFTNYLIQLVQFLLSFFT